MSKPTDDQTFRVTLRAEPGDWDAPVAVRLRRALKCLLRAFGLRCVEVRQMPADEDQAARGRG